MVKPSGQQSPEDAEARILDAADAVFVRRGTDGARMQEIADEAGVNKALLHYYYRTKELLSAAVFERAASAFIPAIFQIMASDAELEEKIDHFVATYLDQLSRRPYLPGYIIGELTHHPQRLVGLFSKVTGGAARRVLRKLGQQIDERVEAGTMAPMKAEQFLITLLGSCIFPFAARPIVMAVLDLDPKGFERFIEQRKRELPSFLKRAMQP